MDLRHGAVPGKVLFEMFVEHGGDPGDKELVGLERRPRRVALSAGGGGARGTGPGARGGRR